MHEPESTRRRELFRDAAIFQLKLMADGFRDLVLVPVSLVAALAGLVRGGDDPGQGFRQVLDLGRRSEQWINLFGQHDPPGNGGDTASLDGLLARAEGLVRQQAREGGISESTRKAVERVIMAAQRGARRDNEAGEPRKTGE